MPSVARPPPLASLTGLRFFAAFHVVLYHYGGKLVPAALHPLTQAADSAVTLFFVLSGFLLTYNHPRAFDGGFAICRRFYLARCARVYPLYALLVLLEFGLWLGPSGVPFHVVAPATLAHLGCLQSFIPQLIFIGNGPGWSIGNELFFYLLFPWFARNLFRSNRRIVLVVGLVLTWALSMAMAGSAVLTAAPEREWLELAVRFSPVCRAPEFVLGIGVARLYLLNGARAPSARGDVLAIVVGAALLAALFAEQFVPYTMAHNGFVAPLDGALVYALARARTMTRWLGSRPLLALGEGSYALYLLQQPTYHVLEVLGAPLEGRAAVAGFLLLLVATSLVVHRLVERPLSRWVRESRLRRWAARAAEPRDSFWLGVPILLAGLIVAWLRPEHRFLGTRIMGAEWALGVDESGMEAQEWQDRKPVRFTNGDGRLSIPVEPPARHLRVDLASGDPEGTPVEVLVNGVSCFDGLVPAGPWSQTVPLDQFHVFDRVALEIRSPTYAPADMGPGSNEPRRLGIKVLGVHLE